MKPVTYLLALSFCAGMFAGCSDNEDKQPAITTMTINENMTNDGGTVYKKEDFIYEDSILTSHTTMQGYGEQQSLSQTTTFAYFDNQVVITYESGNVATYTLGADGYATQCQYQMGEQLRRYEFAYQNEYLTQVDETIDGEPFSSVTLQYIQGNLVSISFGENNKIACSTSQTANYSKLPFIKLADFHPLSMHMDAMYAHLLGKPTQHMVGGYEPVKEEGSADSSESEKTSYTYVTDEQQRVIDIDEQTIYTGYIYDVQGTPHLTTSSVSRNLTISYN